MSEEIEKITRKLKVAEMKKGLKDLANRIRKSKPYGPSWEARHLHMLYGVYRGVRMELIESRSRTEICEYTLTKMCEKFEVEVDCDKIIRHSRSILI